MEWFFIGIALIPAFFCPTKLFNGYSVPQTLALGLLSSVGLLLGVWNGLVPTTLPSILSILFSIYMVLSLLWMTPVHNAKKELGQQLPMQLAFLLACAYITWDGMRWVALGFAGMLAAQCLYGQLQTQLIDPFFPPKIKAGGPKDNPIGSIGNPNYFAAYISTTLWLSVYAALAFPRFRILWLVPVAALYMLWRAGCRAGQLAFMGSVAFFILVAAYHGALSIGGLIGNDGLFAVMVAEGLILILFLVVVIKVNWQTFWHKPIDPKGAQVWYASLRYRLCFWVTALYLIRERPLFGWGMWSYRKEVYRMQAWLHQNKWNDFLKYDRYLTPQPREVHNDFIEHVVEFGVVGASLWFLLVGVVYWMGFRYLGNAGGTDFWLMLILLTSMTCAMLDSVFFFLLRLPSSAMVFWVTAGAVVALSGGQVVALGQSLPLALGAVALWGAFVYYCMVTRFMASLYFSLARSSPRENQRGHYLEKAIEWQPSDTILRSFAALSILDYDVTGANFHCMKMFTDFDGMAPQHATYFNIALCRARTRNYFEECAVFLNYGHWLHPYWPPIKDLLLSRDGVGVRSKYVGGERTLVKGNEETLWKVKALMRTRENVHLKKREIDGLKRQLTAGGNGSGDEVLRLKHALLGKEQELLLKDLQACYLSLRSVILLEKKRLNVPDNWFYDKEQGEFLAPVEVDRVAVENLLLPDCMDAAPASPLEGDADKLMDHYMFGKEAYSTVEGKAWDAPPTDGKEGGVVEDGDGTAPAVQ